MRNEYSNQIFSEIGQIETVSISDIKDGTSFRVYKRDTVRKAAKFLETLGFRLPIILDATNGIVEGEVWYHAAKHLALTEVPVLRVNGLTPSQLDAYRIGVQRIPQSGDWDNRSLANLFKQWSIEDIDFDAEITGFTAAEIDNLIQGAAVEVKGRPNDDCMLRSDLGNPVSQVGDLWLAGDHRLLCYDALHEQSLSTLLGREKASVVITDPPYNVAVDGHVGGKGKIRHREFAMASGEMKSDEFTDFLKRCMLKLIAGSIDGALHYIFMDWRHAQELLSAGSSVYTELKNICVWKKSNGGMGSLYRSQHEFIFLYKSGKGKHRNNVELGKHGRNRTNVWEYAGANGFDGRKSDEGELLKLHPTVKPVQMLADALLDSSARGDIVLDIFHGSGSTLIAAERTGRRLYGIEIDPSYVDIAIRRWQRHTGQNAILQRTGKTFDQVMAGCTPKTASTPRRRQNPPKTSNSKLG